MVRQVKSAKKSVADTMAAKIHHWKVAIECQPLAVWPGVIEPGISDELVVNQDMVATFAALVGTNIPDGQAQDSNNLMPLFTGDGNFTRRSYWVNQAGANHEVMIRKYPWKLILQSNNKRTTFEPKALYHLADDPKESKNLVLDPEGKTVSEELFNEYLEITASRRPTVPN